MKIVLFDYVFDRRYPGLSGLSDATWELARGLVALGEEVHIVGPYPPETSYPDGVVIHTYTLPPINYRNIIGHMLIVWKGWRVIQRELSDASLIHTQEYLSSSIFARVGKIPIILTTPSNIYERIHSNANPFDALTTLVYRLAVRMSSRRCAHVIAISKDMKFWWEQSGTPADKISVIPHGVDTNIFAPQPTARQVLDWGAGFHLLFVGRLSKEKGVDLLLEAFNPFARQNPDVHLHIVGEGSIYDRCQAQVKALDLTERVTFYGWIKKYDLPLYYSASDACIVPSQSEPLGRIILEAMACGTPVIGTNVGGIPDLVIPELNGYLFETGDVQQLQHSLNNVLQQDADQRRVMRTQALTFIQAGFSLVAIARRIRDTVYHPVIGKSDAHGTP